MKWALVTVFLIEVLSVLGFAVTEVSLARCKSFIADFPLAADLGIIPMNVVHSVSDGGVFVCKEHIPDGPEGTIAW